MPQSPPRPCSKCGQPVIRSGLCQRHYTQADRARGTSTARGYDRAHRDEFRAPVLEAANYQCAICGDRANQADHYPRTRKQLIADGENPNDPKHGRALCARHHHQYTASYAPGFAGKPAR